MSNKAMTFLPVVERELREAARRNTTHAVRFSCAVAALMLGGFVFHQETRWRLPAQAGASVFQAISGLTFGFCLLSGVFFTSDCLSREKREGTLGLLFLTDLKGYDVGLGKLFASSLSAFYGLVAVFPILAIPIMLGGVTWGDFARMVWVLVNTMFLSLALGMGVSTVSRHERRAASGTFILLLFLAGGLPAIGETYRHWKGQGLAPSAMVLPSPGYTLSLAYSYGFGQFSALFWKSALTVHVIGWGVLVLSWIILPRVWQDRGETVGRFRWKYFMQTLCYGGPIRRELLRQRRLGINPFFWLTSRNRLRQVHLWCILALVGIGWLWGRMVMSNWMNSPFPMFGMFMLHGLLKICVASEACHRLVEDRRSGALELLLSTPLKVREILGGQLHSLNRQFAAPLIATWFLDLFFLSMFLTGRTFSASDRGEITTFFLAIMMLLLLDFGALRWVAMWLAMTAKNSLFATVGTIARIMVLPACLFFVGIAVMQTFRLRPEFEFTLGSWVLLGSSVSLFFWCRAKWALTHRFRTLASQSQKPWRLNWRWRPFERKPPRLTPPILVTR